MDIYDSIKLSRLNYQGKLPKNTGFGNKASKLHYTSSLDGNPAIGRVPSTLDIYGKAIKKYLDNPPK